MSDPLVVDVGTLTEESTGVLRAPPPPLDLLANAAGSEPPGPPPPGPVVAKLTP